jgi:hypothetical protein
VRSLTEIEISALELDVRLRKICLKLLKRQRKRKDPQKASLDSSLAEKTEIPVGLKFLSKKFKDLLGFLVLYHYYPMEPSVYVYFHLDLQEQLEVTESFWLSVLLENKDYFLIWLEEQRTISAQVFFSGIANEKNLERLIRNIVFTFEEKFKKPRKLVRRKGYRDKGSLGPLSSRVLKKELKNDFYLTVLQYQIEEKALLRRDLSILLRDHLTKGRVLTQELLVEFRITSRKEDQSERSRCKGSTPEEDYCKRRALEDTLRAEKEHRKAVEAARTQASEPKVYFDESSKH